MRPRKLEEMINATMGKWVSFILSTGKKVIDVIKVALLAHTAAKAAIARCNPALGEVVAMEGLWRCVECKQSFQTKQALVAHDVRHHQRLRLAIRFLRGTTCPICMRAFGCRSKLLNHVYKQPANGKSSS